MVKGREQHVAAKRHPARPRRDRSEHRHQRSEISVISKRMLSQPNRIESSLLDEIHLAKHLGIKACEIKLGEGWIAEIQHVTDFHQGPHQTITLAYSLTSRLSCHVWPMFRHQKYMRAG